MKDLTSVELQNVSGGVVPLVSGVIRVAVSLASTTIAADKANKSSGFGNSYPAGTDFVKIAEETNDPLD